MPNISISRLSQFAGAMVLLLFPGGYIKQSQAIHYLNTNVLQMPLNQMVTRPSGITTNTSDGELNEPSEFDAQRELVRFDKFVETVRDGNADVVRGVYVPGHLASRVIQQPSGSSTYVSNRRGSVTQFRPAAKYGVTGLVAHNYLGGYNFYELKPGMVVHLVYGDGKIKEYQVKEIHRYRKLSPHSTSSNLIDLSTGNKVTTLQVFNRFYRGGPRVTFQTCLEKDGNLYWGLLFVVAEPILN